MPITVTVSPLNAWLFGAVETTVEYAVSPGFSVAAIGALGTWYSDDIRGFEVGGQVRWYSGRPRWWNPNWGIQAFWTRVVSDEMLLGLADPGPDWPPRDRYITHFIGLGPFVGSKWVGARGFTIDLQAGIHLVRFNEEGEAPEGFGLPTLNLNFGWSFPGP